MIPSRCSGLGSTSACNTSPERIGLSRSARRVTSNTLSNGNARVNRNGPFFLISSFPVSKNVAARFGDNRCGTAFETLRISEEAAQ